ncbi:MAG: DUF6883 domain-containing protein [Hyphomonadaceae bacterium]
MPHAHLAFVERPKLVSYLLNRGHEEGGPKANFLEAIGFDLTLPEALEAALLAHAAAHDATEIATPFGVKYHVDGVLISPAGRSAYVRTVWQIDAGSVAPRFVTLRPRVKR